MRYAIFGLTLACVMTTSLRAQDETVNDLIESMSAADTATRLEAIDELADLGAGANPAVDALRSALTDENADVRWRAARTLGAIGEGARAAEPELVKALGDDDPRVRSYAAFALGEMDADADANVTRMLELVLDEDSTVRRAVIQALRKMDPPPDKTAPVIAKMFENADPALVMLAIRTAAEDGAAAVPRLIKALEHEEAVYWACMALHEIGPEAKDAVPALTKVVTDHAHEECRMQALMALGAIGPAAAPATDVIVKALDEEKDFGGIQYAAAYALGSIGDKAAGDALQKTLLSDNEFLKIVGAWALARLNPDDKEVGMRSAEVIVAGLTSDDSHVRAAAARALQEFQGYEGVVGAALVEALTDSDPVVVGNALDALAGLGPKVVPHIQKGLRNPELRGLALRVIQRLGDDGAAAVPALTSALAADDGDAEFRSQAQYTLGLLGPAAKPALPELIKSLDSKEENVRNSAIFALAKMGPAAKPAGRALVQIMEDESQDPHARAVSGWALLEITENDPRIARSVAPLLIRTLEHENPAIRAEAARTLGSLGQHGKPALGSLDKLKNDPDPDVRAAAEQAVAKLQGSD